MKYQLYLLLLMFPFTFLSSSSAQQLSLDEIPVGEWIQVDVEEGICIYGGDYSFFVRLAQQPTDKLLVHFQGGGACWDGLTCGSIGEFASFYEVTPDTIGSYSRGIFDVDNPDNPLAGYHAVFVPYCTGDVHSGDNQLVLTVPSDAEADFETIDVNFNGYRNAQLVLEWVYDNMPQPEEIAITGCSAGGYGAITHAPFIMEQYAGIPATMLADSSHGVIMPAWEGLTLWNTIATVPTFIPDAADLTLAEFSTTRMMEVMSDYFPDNEFAQYNSYIDGVQIGFYAASLGFDLDFDNSVISVAGQWTAALLSNLQRLAELDNFYSYTGGGSQHCVITSDLFYQFDQSGVIFSEWFAGVMQSDAPDVSCSVLFRDCFISPVED